MNNYRYVGQDWETGSMDFCGIVLAGGKSRRMGTDKSRLTLGGQTFLEIQVNKLKDLGASEVLVSDRYRDPSVWRSSVSGRHLHLPGVRHVPDLIPDMGPLGGLYSCFSSCKGLPALVLSVDVPLISLSTLEGLLAAYERNLTVAGEKGCDHALVLTHAGQPEPLIAVYDTNTAPVIRDLTDAGDLAVSSFLNRIGYSCLEFDGEPRELLNCNIPEDLLELQS